MWEALAAWIVQEKCHGLRCCFERESIWLPHAMPPVFDRLCVFVCHVPHSLLHREGVTFHELATWLMCTVQTGHATVRGHAHQKEARAKKRVCGDEEGWKSNVK